MTLLDDVPVGASVGLDTAPLVYLIEGHPVFQPVIRPLFVDRLDRQLNTALTSVLGLAEVLVLPLRNGRMDLVQAFRGVLTGHPAVVLIRVRQVIAEWAAELRARYSLRIPDAVQLATALQEGADVFVTNDLQFRRVTELRVLILQDYLPPTP